MKRTFNWAIPGLLGMIAVIVTIAWVQSLSAASPDLDRLVDQCGSCHTMDQHVATWRESSHRDVACTACHADPGVMGWVKMQVGQVQMLMSARRGTDLSQVATTVSNERCISCHAREMPWVMQDLKPPAFDEKGQPIRVAAAELSFLRAIPGHDLHLSGPEPLSCMECHSFISHGPAPEFRAERVDVMHDNCLNCHLTKEIQVTVNNSIACSICHVDLEAISPDDHKSPAFRVSHGKSAITDINNCQQCHLNPGIGTASTPHGLITAFAQATDLKLAATVSSLGARPRTPQMPPGSLKVGPEIADACTSCHGISMPHPTAWLTQHTSGYKDDPALCASCHGNRETGFKMTVLGDPQTLSTTDPSCTSCHAQPMPHPPGWVPSSHTLQAKAVPLTCEQCHSPANAVNPGAAHTSSRFCLDCHLSGYRHPKGYVGTHKFIIAASNGSQMAAGCTQCHTPTENTCASCHTDGFERKQQWHDRWFWVTHARTTNSSNIASCKNCHDYVQPSCSQCHRNY